MKPKHIKKVGEKEVRRIWKGRIEVCKEIRGLGYVALNKPIRHGWFKEIIITHKVERYKNRAAIEEVYDKIEKIFWGKTKEEAQKKWNTQTSKHLIYKDLPTLSKKQFNKLSGKAQLMCTPFFYKNERKKLKLRFYIRIPKGAYRIKYTRAYITHSKRIDPVLESEATLLEQQLLKKGYYEAVLKRDQWKDYWNISQNKKEKLKTKRTLRKLHEYAIEDIVNEKIIWEIN